MTTATNVYVTMMTVTIGRTIMIMKDNDEDNYDAGKYDDADDEDLWLQDAQIMGKLKSQIGSPSVNQSFYILWYWHNWLIDQIIEELVFLWLLILNLTNNISNQAPESTG